MNPIDRLPALARDHGGPIVAATALALLAVLPVALTIFDASAPAMSVDDIDRHAPSPGEAVLVVLVTLALTALVAGGLGGVVQRWFRVTGAAVALVLAWLVGALVLPVVAAVLGVEVRTAVLCFDTCDAMLDSAQPTAALLGVLVGMVLMVVTVVVPVVAIVLTVAGTVLNRRRHATAAVTCVAVAFGAFNVLAFALGNASVAYLCLGVGVVAWDRWLAVRSGDAAVIEAAPAG